MEFNNGTYKSQFNDKQAELVMGQYGWIPQWSENVIESYVVHLQNNVKVYDLPTLKAPFQIWSKFDYKCTVGEPVRNS